MGAIELTREPDGWVARLGGLEGRGLTKMEALMRLQEAVDQHFLDLAKAVAGDAFYGGD